MFPSKRIRKHVQAESPLKYRKPTAGNLMSIDVFYPKEKNNEKLQKELYKKRYSYKFLLAWFRQNQSCIEDLNRQNEQLRTQILIEQAKKS